MGKITFRADEALIARLEEVDDSKSEVMRRALREYLGEPAVGIDREPGTIEDRIGERVDDIIEARLADRLDRESGPGSHQPSPQDVHVTVTLDGDPSGESASAVETRSTAGLNSPVDSDRDIEADREAEDRTCKQCGELLAPGAVFCQNCGEKSSQRVFCDCGDELRTDWAFCPTCGRRTPAADVLENP